MASNLGLISGFRLDTLSREDVVEERITEASSVLASHPAATTHQRLSFATIFSLHSLTHFNCEHPSKWRENKGSHNTDVSPKE